MGKLGLILILVVAALLWFRFKTKGSTPKRKRDARSEPMLACGHCGVYLPASEVVADASGRPYCCEAHREAVSRRP